MLGEPLDEPVVALVFAVHFCCDQEEVLDPLPKSVAELPQHVCCGSKEEEAHSSLEVVVLKNGVSRLLVEEVPECKLGRVACL